MKFRAVRAFLTVIATLIFAFGSAPFATADQLWDRAVAAHPRSVQWAPFEHVMESREYNGSGELRSHSRVTSRAGWNAEGEFAMEVVEAEQLVGRGDPEQPFGGLGGRRGGDDGGDSDDRSQSETAQRFAAVSASPFDPLLQDRLTLRRQGIETLPDGRRGVAYAFVLRPNEVGRAEGTVWLDPESGLPVKVAREVDPPLSVIERFALEERFRPGDDHWVATNVSVAVTGKVLMIERRYEMEMTFRDHRLDPEAAAAMRRGGAAGR